MASPIPTTPDAFLPAEKFELLLTSRYIMMVCVGVISWDVISNLSTDYQVLKGRFSGPSVAYVVARVATLLFSVINTVFTTINIGVDRCFIFQRSFSWLYPVSMSFTTLLFFFRIRAVFSGNLFIIAFFLLLWLSVVVSTSLTVLFINGRNIGPTGYCISQANSPHVSIAGILPLVYDTLVFVAIALKLTKSPTTNRRGTVGNVKTFVSGSYLPRLSRSLLQDGQIYYLATVTTNVLTLIFLHVPSQREFRSMSALPNLVITNILTCAAFRNLRYTFVVATAASASGGGSTVPMTSFDRDGRPKNSNVNGARGVGVTSSFGNPNPHLSRGGQKGVHDLGAIQFHKTVDTTVDPAPIPYESYWKDDEENGRRPEKLAGL